MQCVYCDRPLICDKCDTEFEPTTPEQYEALSRTEVPVVCPSCEAILVCHWCHFPYDGEVEDSYE